MCATGQEQVNANRLASFLLHTAQTTHRGNGLLFAVVTQRHAPLDTGPPSSPTHLPEADQTAPHWPGILYGLIALTGCVFAFVGLSTSSFWADELFTMRVIHPTGGIAGVFSRVLTDVHPPVYYFFLYGWTQLFGTTEFTTRLPSAVMAVSALLVFAYGVRRLASPTATAFACALTAGCSLFWFEQAQNARSYGLILLISSGLLATAIALYRHARTSSNLPIATWLLLTALGLIGSQTHSYMLLAFGMLLLYLIVTLRHGRLRIAFVASGVVVLAVYLMFLWLLAHAGAHAGANGFAGTWFQNNPPFFATQIRRAVLGLTNRQSAFVVAIMLLVLLAHRRKHTGKVFVSDRDHGEANWAAGLCGFVLVGTIVCGIGVSLLVAPSFSYRNVLTCAPFGWLLIARLYDLAGPRVRTRSSAVLAGLVVLLISSQMVVLLRGRMLPLNEAWRASSEYVRGLPGCAGPTLPVVVMPGTYGSAMNADVHEMVEHDYFGYYLPPSYHLHAYLPDELMQHYAESKPTTSNSSSACPLVAWGLHDLDQQKALNLAMRLAREPGVTPPDVEPHQIVLQELLNYQLQWVSWNPHPSAFVFMLATPPTLAAHGPAVDRTHSYGDRFVVSYNNVAPSVGTAPDTFSVQRWHAGKMVSETSMTITR